MFLVTQLQKRWKGLRSCFNREKKKHKNQKSSSAAANSRKEYQYYTQLSFLASISDIRPITNPPENVLKKSPMAETLKFPMVDTTKSPMVETSKFKESEKTYENGILRRIPDNFEKKQEINDHDLNFLHSMLPHFKKVSDEYKLDLQSEILYTLKKYINYSRPNNNLNQFSQQYGCFSNSPTTSTLTQNTAASPADTYVSLDSVKNENMFTEIE